MHEDFAERFWSRVDKSEKGCWLWTGSRLPRGYGRVYPYIKVGLYAHRVSWEITNGRPVPDGMHVCHHCDNPQCVRPDHLFIGTRSDNMRDCAAKGRLNSRSLKGEAHPQSVLTELDVVAIRAAAADGIPRRVIAAKYGVSRVNVGYIVRRRAWKHVA